MKILVLSDVHYPYHDKDALWTAIEYGKAQRCDSIIFLGDFLDCYQISKYGKDPRKRSLGDELDGGRELLRELTKGFRNKYYYIGNHEARLQHYLENRAPQLVGLRGTTLGEQLDLARNKITLLDAPVHFGKLLFLHGHELAGRGGVNVHDTLWRQLHTHAICGHFHRSMSKTYRTYEGQRYWCGSVGFLGGPQDYCPVNQWTTGFATVEIDNASGQFRAKLHEIHETEVF
jgi:predicted phosphodiesterase